MTAHDDLTAERDTTLLAGRVILERNAAWARLAEAEALLRRWRATSAFGTISSDTDAFLAAGGDS